MRIFITGADGFIGQAMVERLKDQHELEFLKEDLRDHAKVGFQIKQFDPEIIVHLAARTEVQDSFYPWTIDLNYQFGEQYNFEIKECKWDTGSRIYAEWIKK